VTNTLSIVYFPAAVALGALHALEPGHAKALTASYLIGIKGTKKDSVILGLSVATTHSFVVILISGIALWIGNEAFTGNATEWLERASGIVAISIGSWMLWRRLRYRAKSHDDHHHAPDPIVIRENSIEGVLEIVNTPLGEKMRFTSVSPISLVSLNVEIDRENNQIETLELIQSEENKNVYLSTSVPGEPHEFTARFLYAAESNNREVFHFLMKEPADHHEGHEHLDDIAHAKAHAETLPEYAKNGEKPTIGQIITFGAAGGMIPCPASITVMLLALSTGKAAMGVFTVLGFSLGLALALVGIGLVVVTGLSHISDTSKFSWISRQAPIISAVMVIVSGVFALSIAH
jgi:nickel/cobalt exporter